MKHKLKNNRKKLLKTFIQYGLHLWLIIFLCNIAVVYAVRFFLFASTDTPTATQPTTTPKPGPVVKIDLILPGISSEGGNLKPLYPERDISVNLYNPDANISDQKVNPIHSIKAKVTFDADPDSPTYTHFINSNVDLGEIVQGEYQIAIHTQQTLLSAIKDPKAKPSSLGGKVFSLQNNGTTTLPVQTMISGDIYPAGNNDNVMDINDYNIMTDCFNNNTNTSKCPDASYADLDDNGAVDGVDYNIMLTSFRTLKSLGYPIPTIATPTPIITITSIATPASKMSITPIKKQIKASSGGGLGFVILLIIVIILGAVGLILFKLHLLDGLLKRIRRPGNKKNDEGSTGESNTGEPNTGEPSSVQPNSNEPSAGESSSPNTGETGTEENSNTNIIEKSGYLKKTSTDSQTNDTWVTLADDNGVSIGLYHGKNVIEGFVKIKGTMQTDKNNKQYILISEIEEEK